MPFNFNYLFALWHKIVHPINLKPYELLNNQKIEDFKLLKNQGHCNINYLIKTDKSSYVLRKFKHQSEHKAEFYIQNLAHKKGISAKALVLDEEKQLMICDYIVGEHRYKLDQKTLKKLALMLKKLHKIKLQQQATNFKGSFKYKDKKAQEAFRVIDTFKPEYVLGHNDLHPKNILFGKKIQFIDWEYAGKADRYFDLAAIILEFKLNKKDEATFLRNYFSKNGKVNHKKLKAFKVVYKTLWTVWFAKLERGQIATV
jgi:thiamine kinase-like enzyme